MSAASRIRKPQCPRRLRAATLLCAGLLLFSCSRGAPRAEPKKPEDAPRPAPAAENAVRSAPIETPRTVMKPLVKDDAERKAPLPRSDLSVPSLGETARFPRDYGIGALGAGNGDKAAYREALAFLASAAAGKPVADRFAADGERRASSFAALISPLGSSPAVRAGSPAPAGDGGVSFLVRVVGSAGSASGEILMSPASDGRWLVASVALENDAKDGGPSAESDFDPLLYKRFL